jgi:hypothetical protein
MVGRVLPRHGHCGRPLNSVVRHHMNGVPKVRAVGLGLVIAAFSVGVAYFGLDELITGKTRALSKFGHYDPVTGHRGITVAIAYLIFSGALASFAAMGFSAEPSRQATFLKWGRRIGITAGIVLFAGAFLT